MLFELRVKHSHSRDRHEVVSMLSEFGGSGARLTQADQDASGFEVSKRDQALERSSMQSRMQIKATSARIR